jgi:LuxR family maltose regulon positive regulatory protein
MSVLVLDNADEANLPGLNQALLELPPLMHVIVLSRRSLPLRLGRLRATHHVCEIREQDLRFTPPEAYALLETVIQTRLSRDDIRTLWSVTRGWVAGMMLAISVDFTLKREAIPLEREWWRTWDGYLDSYYQEEVLDVLPHDIQQSLLMYAELPLLTS